MGNRGCIGRKRFPDAPQLVVGQHGRADTPYPALSILQHATAATQLRRWKGCGGFHVIHRSSP